MDNFDSEYENFLSLVKFLGFIEIERIYNYSQNPSLKIFYSYRYEKCEYLLYSPKSVSEIKSNLDFLNNKKIFATKINSYLRKEKINKIVGK